MFLIIYKYVNYITFAFDQRREVTGHKKGQTGSLALGYLKRDTLHGFREQLIKIIPTSDHWSSRFTRRPRRFIDILDQLF